MQDSSSMAAAVLGIPEKAHMISSISLSCVRSSSNDQMNFATSWEDLCSRADLKL